MFGRVTKQIAPCTRLLEFHFISSVIAAHLNRQSEEELFCFTVHKRLTPASRISSIYQRSE